MLAIGADGMRVELTAAGLEVTMASEIRSAGRTGGPLDRRHDAVIVGLDPDVDYWSLAVAMSAVAGGARLIATNADARYPTPSGFLPGAGAILAALTTATGATPEVIGKPSPAMFAAILEASGIGADEAVVIGDNPDADVVGAHRAGLAAILVLTGVADAPGAAALDGRASPGGRRGGSGRGAFAPGRPTQVMVCPDHQASHARVAAAKIGLHDDGRRERTAEAVQRDRGQLVGVEPDRLGSREPAPRSGSCRTPCGRRSRG